MIKIDRTPSRAVVNMPNVSYKRSALIDCGDVIQIISRDKLPLTKSKKSYPYLLRSPRPVSWTDARAYATSVSAIMGYNRDGSLGEIRSLVSEFHLAYIGIT
jgi:hypothetical protein